jgi:hypothetical protein
MAKVTTEAKAFFEDIRESIDILSKHYAQLSSANDLDEFTAIHKKTIQTIDEEIQSNRISRKEYEAYIAYMMQGLIHSVLVSIDGGSASADGGRKFWLVDKDGKDICPALHECFDPAGDDWA